MLINFLFLILLKLGSLFPNCIEGENYCLKCNPISKLCFKCEKDIFIPDENGGCIGSKKCHKGENYCVECDNINLLCETCEIGYFPDQNGGCSYTDNCDISYHGKCLSCIEDYVLIGGNVIDTELEIKFCKPLNSEDLKNCEKINIKKGFCEQCIEGYFLSKGDNKCIKMEHCYESIFGTCLKCIDGYYLDKKEEKCIKQEGIFKNCLQSIDSNTCDICKENYFLDEEGKCGKSNFCSKFDDEGLCEKCFPGYYPSSYDNSCTTEKDCYYAYEEFGICHLCQVNYYIDLKDGKCKSNQEDNDYKNCYSVGNEGCIVCETGYELGEDLRCSSSKNCMESEFGLCIECQENYFLGLDHICTPVEHCLYSMFYECIQCEDNYYYDKNSKKCKKDDGNFKNCQYSKDSICQKCREDYYLNKTDYLCYSNLEMGDYYKCAMTDENYTYCISCVKDYYYGFKYKKCSILEGCENSLDEKKCIECYSDFYCLDLKTGRCEYSDEVIDEEKKFYYKCNITNEEGTACDICLEGFSLNEDGLCIDNSHCVEKNEEGNCLRCQNDENGSYCLNPIFGCVELYYDNCLECSDLFNLDKCTKCYEGYEIDVDNYQCYEIEE